MSNEFLLIFALVVTFSVVVLFYYLFGKSGLYCFTVLATITANIEVLILVNAFGMEQTLGNILFASSFLVTDILSEIYGKRRRKKPFLSASQPHLPLLFFHRSGCITHLPRMTGLCRICRPSSATLRV